MRSSLRLMTLHMHSNIHRPEDPNAYIRTAADAPANELLAAEARFLELISTRGGTQSDDPPYSRFLAIATIVAESGVLLTDKDRDLETDQGTAMYNQAKADRILPLGEKHLNAESHPSCRNDPRLQYAVDAGEECVTLVDVRILETRAV